MENSSSNPPPSPAKIPDSIKLYNLFNQFFIRWANQETKYVNMGMDDLAPLDLEQGIYFFEPLEGIMVIRSTREFEKFLVELACGKKAKKNYEKQGLFLEMVVLFWHLFVSQVWRLDTRLIKPAILKKSFPAEWPDRRPDTALTVFIKNYPLTVRLWAPVTPEEAKSWKKSP